MSDKLKTILIEDLCDNLWLAQSGFTREEAESLLLQSPLSLLKLLYRSFSGQDCGFIEPEDNYRCRISVNRSTICGIHKTRWREPEVYFAAEISDDSDDQEADAR